MLPRSALTFLLVLFLCPAAARAQADLMAETAAPAHVSHVEGTVVLERDGKNEGSPLNMPLLSGDRLKTQDGRVEVLFADGSTLHLDGRTTVDIQSDDLARLIDGRLRLAIAGPSRTVAYRVDSPAGSVRIAQAGEYRISLLHPSAELRAGGETETQLELAVIRGGGEIFTDQGSTAVRAGERAYASAGLTPSYAYAYNSANWDAFDRWSEARRDTRLGVSAQYLPEDVRTYSSTFDEYGDWRYQPTYGNVWYPRVAAGWRPYYYGRWMAYPRYGWTWIGADAFAYPTHHYGRWGFSAGAWFWIPSAHWAPAYVSWAYAPGYVSWCPLGFNNRPLVSINLFSVGPHYYSAYYPWTAVSYSHFGHGYYVHQRAVNWNQWDRRTTWQAGRVAPAGRDIAVPRGSTVARPIHWVGRRDLSADASRVPGSGLRSSTAAGSGSGLRSSASGLAGSDPRAAAPGSGLRSSASGLPGSDPRAVSPGSGLRSSAGDAASARSGNTAVPRGTATPRYVNRGDQIIRSQTERPSAPAPRGDIAVQRVTPSGPAQRVDVTPQMDRGPAAVTERRSTGFSGERAVPRSGGVPDAPAYAPRTGPGYAPRTGSVPPAYGRPDGRGFGRTEPSVRSVEPRTDAPAYRTRPSEPAAAQAPAAPREFGRAPDAARPRGGAADSRPFGAPPSAAPASPAPNSGFRHAPPSAPPSGGGQGTATPRAAPAPQGGGGAQARPRGGRGGV